MKVARQHGVPLIIADLEGGRSAVRLERLHFERGHAAGEAYDESWLQHVLQGHPELLPIDEIEPAYWPVVPVCRELPTSRGYIDNFFITPSGNLVFAECKLWRNAEARRAVITQVMDYAESLTEWTYEGLEQAVSRAQSGDGKPGPGGLYDLVAEESELDEARFVDAVSRNLRLGRGLFFVVGDGIREEVETLAAHLQSHAGMHFALALLELAVFRLPGKGGYLFQPRTITRTVNIERGIVRVEDSRAVVQAPERPVVASGSGTRQSLTAEEFYERIAETDSQLPTRIRAFLAEVEELGVEPEFKKTLILRWRAVDGTAFNLGYVFANGETWTERVCWKAEDSGTLDLARCYVNALAEAIGGEVLKIRSDENQQYVAKNGKAARIGDLLSHKEAWLRAIVLFTEGVNERLEGR